MGLAVSDQNTPVFQLVDGAAFLGRVAEQGVQCHDQCGQQSLLWTDVRPSEVRERSGYAKHTCVPWFIRAALDTCLAP